MKRINLVLTLAAPVIAGIVFSQFGTTAGWIYVASHAMYTVANLTMIEADIQKSQQEADYQ